MKSFFKKKAIRIIVCIFCAFALIVGVSNGIFAYIGIQFQEGTAVCDKWSATDEFDISKVKSLDMGKDEFKVLCLTDVHIRNHGTFAAFLGINFILDGISKIQLKQLIKEVDPDLITVGGDTVLTAWNDIETENFCEFMDSFETPWAPVYGNHDYQGRADKAKLSEIYLNSKYCLFECGPDGMNGMGNYVINLERNGMPVYSVFMFDNGQYRIIDGDITSGGISQNQIDWYNWNVNGIEKSVGKKVPSMAFMHVPVPEYEEQKDGFIDGIRGEGTSTAVQNDGFFDVFKSQGGTHMFAGHDHNNNFISEHDGIQLNYVTKSSYNCYFSFDSLGGTLITFGEDDKPAIEIVNF